MPFNSSGNSFAPLEDFPIFQPTVTVGPQQYSGLTTAQCAANGALTSRVITNAGLLVDAAKVRVSGIILIVPTDQQQVTFGNDSPVAGSLAAFPIIPVIPVNTFGQQVANAAGPSSSNGYAIPPGNSVFVANFNDPVYGITPPGVTSTIYFIDV
jgi:hypothetical protein